MAQEIIMPKLGVDMQEGEILCWKKSEGDPVQEGDILLEMMSDKTNMELEAEDSGVLLKIVHKDGEVVPVTTVIGYIGEPGEEIDAPDTLPEQKESVQPVLSMVEKKPESAPAQEAPLGKVRATPAARKAAREHQVNLFGLKGRGERGRIHVADVLEALERAPKASPLAAKMAQKLGLDLADIEGTGYKHKIMKEDIERFVASTTAEAEVMPAEPKEAPYEEATAEGVRTIKMSAMRKAIAQSMLNSYLTAPTFTLNYEVDMTNMIALRKQLIEPIKNKCGLKVSFTDLIGLATARILAKEEHSYLNASLIHDAKEIELHDFVNLAIAVGLPDGLVVPVVPGADKLSITEFVVAAKDVISRAQTNKLKADEMRGSTFTITNLGMFGVKSFNPIINQPNSAILGISATVDTPVALDGEVVVRPIMGMSLTIDHRIVDGMAGAKFMLDLKELLENPIELLI